MRFSTSNLISPALCFALVAACGTRNLPTTGTASQEPWLEPEEEDDVSTEESSDSLEMDLDDMVGELPPPVEQTPHPLEELSDSEIEEILLNNEAELGPVSLGRTNSGALFGALPMPESELWTIVNPRETFGTQETIDYLSHTIRRVNELYPGSPPINIGDISKPSGGHFSPHVSHQSGRDVDLGFYYLNSNTWYAEADASNLDLPRTWAFIKFTITETDVAAIFVDRSIQTLLRDYATELGEDETWLDHVFGGPASNLRPMLLHEPGHQTHLHIRYYNPIAQETGRRVYQALIKHKKIKPPTFYIKHKVRRGDTLGRMARKYNTSVAVLKKANGLGSTRIIAGRSYKIPRRGGVVQPPKLVLPARRGQVESTAQAAFTSSSPSPQGVPSQQAE